MAQLNEEIKEELVLEHKLSKKDLFKHFMLGYSSETCYNYERLQALGRASASVVLLKKLSE